MSENRHILLSINNGDKVFKIPFDYAVKRSAVISQMFEFLTDDTSTDSTINYKNEEYTDPEAMRIFTCLMSEPDENLNNPLWINDFYNTINPSFQLTLNIMIIVDWSDSQIIKNIVHRKCWETFVNGITPKKLKQLSGYSKTDYKSFVNGPMIESVKFK